jgi:hypothetical protein
MLLLKTAVPLAQATIIEIHRDRLFVACVLLSVLLHALALVAYQGQTSIGLRVFESGRAPPIEVTLRPSMRSLRTEEISPAENAGPRVERSRLSGSSPNSADLPAQSKTRPDGDRSAPHIDTEAARGMVREIERARENRAGPPTSAKSGLEYDTPLGRSIAKAARPDCRTAYAGAGLLAIPVLVWDAFTDGGCRW